MWFDARAALAEIEGRALPSSKPAPEPAQDSRRAQADNVAPFATLTPPVAHVAHVARPLTRNPETALRTWTGRVVSLAAWRDLTEWERYGPNGRHWNGITKLWEKPEEDDKGRC